MSMVAINTIAHTSSLFPTSNIFIWFKNIRNAVYWNTTYDANIFCSSETSLAVIYGLCIRSHFVVLQLLAPVNFISLRILSLVWNKIELKLIYALDSAHEKIDV